MSILDGAQAQVPNPAVGFRNFTDTNVIVQGFTIVKGVQRRGPVLTVNKKGGMAFENNVPQGVRYYTIYDANQPSRILLQDAPMMIQTRDVSFWIETSKLDPQRVVLRIAP